MKAILVHAYGPPENMVLGERASPTAGPGQVVVEVHACGVNFTDVLSSAGRSQLKRQMPLTPGVEAAGVIMAVGEGVTRLKVGDRVFGNRSDGCFAEEVLFRQDEVAVIPDAMPMDHAAAFYTANMTTYHALVTRADLRPGENLLVLGAGGGVGLVGVEMGKALGAHVVAAASSQEKLDLAKEKGADAFVLYDRGPLDLAAQKAFSHEILKHAPRAPDPDWASLGELNTMKAEAGYHVVLDGVGGSYAEPCLRSLGWEGRYLSVGFAAGMANVALGPALFKNADIMGIQPSSDKHRLPGRNPGMIKQLFEWYLEGRLQPHLSATLPIARAGEALQLMLDRKATGRIVLMTDRAK